jgi:hypothetical protein
MLKSNNQNAVLEKELMYEEIGTLCCAAIASSAGGFEALKELIEKLPNSLSNIAILIAQPLEDEQLKSLNALVSSGSCFSVRRAVDLEPLQAGIIYTTIPQKSLAISAGFIKLSPSMAGNQHHAADILFQSLAELNSEKIIAIVLSGTGSDGASGVKLVKRAGGKVMVQMPQTANYDGMPLAAIATACVDKILPPYEMGNALLEIYAQYFESSKSLQNGQTGNNNLKHSSKSDSLLSGLKIQHAELEMNLLNAALLGIEDMAKDALFNSYHHTCIVIDKAGFIKEIKGDTALFHHMHKSNIIQQSLWNVMNQSLQNEVHAVLSKAIAERQVVNSTVEIIQIENQLFFIRILVKPIWLAFSEEILYLLILENLDPNKFVANSVSVSKKDFVGGAMPQIATYRQP